MANEPAITRYRQLLERADFDLKLARDVALSLALPSRRIARLNRARRELGDERDLVESTAAAEWGGGEMTVIGVLAFVVAALLFWWAATIDLEG